MSKAFPFLDLTLFKYYKAYFFLGKMKYRSKADIISMVLEAAGGGGATKTKIMYHAYLSYNQLSEYLTMMLENGLEYIEGEKKFKTTEKGLQFLKTYSEIGSMIPRERKTRVAETQFY